MVEEDLRAEGMNVRVVNMGSSGYRSAQVLRLLESYVLPHHPAFLLVDCMWGDSERLPRDYGTQWAGVRGILFESRLYRLLRLGVAKAEGQNTGPTDTVRIEQPKTAISGPGNHAEIMELARMTNTPLIFVDYPFTGTPIKSLAPDDRLPRGATVAHTVAALNASNRPATALFLENNHLSAEGSRIVGRTVADTLKHRLQQ